MNDPFLKSRPVVDRLWSEFLKHEKLIVALDFDDTIYDCHARGHRYTKVIKLVKQCQELGFYIIIFTASIKERYPLIKDYCASIGIHPFKINENAVDMPIGRNGKIYYNILLDDRAGLSSAYKTLKTVVDRITRSSYGQKLSSYYANR